MTTDLILACHGQSVQRENGRLLGWWTDVPLSPLGGRQALLLGGRLQRDANIQSLYTSPLRRARETASLIGDCIQVTPIVEPALRELDSGDLAGLSYEEARTQFPDLIVHGKVSADGRIPGGESYADLHHRVEWAITRMIKRAPDHQIAVITHGGPIVAYLRAFMGYGPESNHKPRFVCNPTSVHHLRLDGLHEKTVVSLNDIAHLSDMPT